MLWSVALKNDRGLRVMRTVHW